MANRKFQKGLAPLAIIALIAVLGGGGAVVASDNARPGDPLYSIDTATENVTLALASSSQAQARLQANLANERIEEAVSLANENRQEHLAQALQRYEDHLTQAQQKAEEAQAQGNNVDDVLAILAENATRHQEVLADVLERVPDEAKEAIQRAMERSMRGFEEATSAVSGEKQEELRTQHQERLDGVRERLEEQGIELPSMDGTNGTNTPSNQGGNGSQGSGNAPDTPVQGRP